jgi:hypothetical protein
VNTALDKFTVVGSGAAAPGVLAGILHERPDAEVTMFDVGKHVAIPFLRRPAKWFLKKLPDYLSGFNIPDLNSGLRVFRRELAERFFAIFPEGFSFTTTITLAALTNGYRVRFLPINYFKRTGHSTIRPMRDFFGFVLLIIRMIVYFKPLNVFLPVMCDAAGNRNDEGDP